MFYVCIIIIIKTTTKSLTDMVIRYFQRCFGFALKQNKDNQKGVPNGLKSIVPHAYSDHSSCANWCGYLKNPASHKHRGLPHGKDLTDKSLRQSLEKTIEVSTVYMMHGGTAYSSQIPNKGIYSVTASECIPNNNCYGKSSKCKGLSEETAFSMNKINFNANDEGTILQSNRNAKMTIQYKWT